MSLLTRKKLLFRMQHRYQQANRKERTDILDGFVAATGYHRKYAVSVLSQSKQGTTVRLVAQRRCIYDEAVRQALISIWNATNQICSKSKRFRKHIL